MSHILDTNGRKLDLGTLEILSLLLSHRNLSLVGRQVGLSQPAMSHLLARVRGIFADPLFIREKAQLSLTPFGERLKSDLDLILPNIAELFHPAAFDPETSALEFKVAITDHAGQVLLPAIVKSLTERAPHCTISIAMIPNRQTDLIQLDEEGYDLRIGWLRSLPAHWRRRKLLDDEIVLIAAASHPALRKPLSVAEFVALEHIALASSRPAYPNLVDSHLMSKGLARNIVSRVTHFSVVPALVAATKLVAMVPNRLARSYAETHSIEILEPPLSFPGHDLSLAWHPRIQAAGDYTWFRRLVVECAEQI